MLKKIWYLLMFVCFAIVFCSCAYYDHSRNYFVRGNTFDDFGLDVQKEDNINDIQDNKSKTDASIY